MCQYFLHLPSQGFLQGWKLLVFKGLPGCRACPAWSDSVFRPGTPRASVQKVTAGPAMQHPAHQYRSHAFLLGNTGCWSEQPWLIKKAWPCLKAPLHLDSRLRGNDLKRQGLSCSSCPRRRASRPSLPQFFEQLLHLIISQLLRAAFPEER